MADIATSSSSSSSSESRNTKTPSPNAKMGLFADFASDFGVEVDIKRKADQIETTIVDDNFTTPASKRSTSQLSEEQASPDAPDNKRVRTKLDYAPKVPEFSPSTASPAGLRGYANRKSPDVVVKKMGLRSPPTALPSGSHRIYTAPTVLQNLEFSGFSFMHTPTELRANALDLHTQFVTSAITKKYGLDDVDPIGPTSQDTQIHVGRICCEAAEGKLNAKSVMLEGSLQFSNARRIRLDLSRIGDYALFPGQIVAVEGNNSGSGSFTVRKLYQGAPAPLPSHTPTQLQEFKTKNDGQPTVVWAASGPYTTSDNMNYQPLADLFNKILKASVKPDVLVLMGPFVSADHPTVRTGHITEPSEDDSGPISLTFEECFRLYVAEPILGFALDNPDVKTTIMLAPSLDDVHHTYCFPQPAFAKSAFQWPEENVDLVRSGRVVLLSNPSAFKVNDVTVSLCTADVVMDTVSEEICRTSGKRTNRVQRGATSVGFSSCLCVRQCVIFDVLWLTQ